MRTQTQKDPGLIQTRNFVAVKWQCYIRYILKNCNELHHSLTMFSLEQFFSAWHLLRASIFLFLSTCRCGFRGKRLCACGRAGASLGLSVLSWTEKNTEKSTYMSLTPQLFTPRDSRLDNKDLQQTLLWQRAFSGGCKSHYVCCCHAKHLWPLQHSWMLERQCRFRCMFSLWNSSQIRPHGKMKLFF